MLLQVIGDRFWLLKALNSLIEILFRALTHLRAPLKLHLREALSGLWSEDLVGLLCSRHFYDAIGFRVGNWQYSCSIRRGLHLLWLGHMNPVGLSASCCPRFSLFARPGCHKLCNHDHHRGTSLLRPAS